MRRRIAVVAATVVLVAAGSTAFLMSRPDGKKGSLVAEQSQCLTSTSTDLKVKPVIEVPSEAAPTTLRSCDLVEGAGAEAVAGKNVRVQYVGVAWSTKKQFDASWDRGSPFPFPLGQGKVIPGWDQGVVGMKVGGRRELVIPPDMGYGARGAGGDIGPNETLVFIVDLLAVD